jgi:hypothetical protein
MQSLSPDIRKPVLSWLRSLNYPWSSPTEVLGRAPSLPELAPVLERLRAGESAAPTVRIGGYDRAPDLSQDSTRPTR